jgi:hypothetical protein
MVRRLSVLLYSVGILKRERTLAVVGRIDLAWAKCRCDSGSLGPARHSYASLTQSNAHVMPGLAKLLTCTGGELTTTPETILGVNETT